MPAIPETMPLGVVLERYEMDNRWQPYGWRAVGVIPGAPPVDDPREIASGEGWLRFHSATREAVLHRGETEGYKRNLANDVPVIYVLLRHDETGDDGVPAVALVTVCPYEAQDYLDADSGEDQVEAVPMPEGVAAWVSAFVAAYHVDEPFKKRKRKDWKDEDTGRRKPIDGHQGGHQGGHGGPGDD